MAGGHRVTVASIGDIGEKIDLKIRQGADFGPITETLVNPDGTSVDLTGCALRGQIRKTADSAEVVAELNFEVVDAAAGVIRWGLTNAQTAGIPAGADLRMKESRYVWDRELVDATGRVVPLSYGEALVWREVTRA